MVDEATQLKFTAFYPTKAAMVEPTCAQLSKWKAAGFPVQFIRMDNAGENKALEQAMNGKDWQLNITPEYTARNSPQQNHLAEVGIAVIGNKARAMMISSNIPMVVRYKLARKAVETATKLDGLTPITLGGVTMTRYEHAFGTLPAFAHNLRIWGEAGVVSLKAKIHSKLTNKGTTCVMVGYAPNHAGDVYEMWNPATSGLHTTRDVRWLNRMYYTSVYSPSTGAVVIKAGESVDHQDDDNDDDDGALIDSSDPFLPPILPTTTQTATAPMTEPVEERIKVSRERRNLIIDTNEYNNQNSNHPPTSMRMERDNEEAYTTRYGRVVKTPQNFASDSLNLQIDDYNTNDYVQEVIELCMFENIINDAEEFEEFALYAKEEIEQAMSNQEILAVGAGIGGGFDNTSELRPMKYKEAMKTKDAKEWQKAVEQEHKRMIERSVWKAVKRQDVPDTAKILTTTWAMKKKANGTYRARLNARGYEQIEGEHYDGYNIAAPVTSDVTIRIVLTLMLMAGWAGEVLDIQGAFLHGLFEDNEELYMEIPEGFEHYYDSVEYLLLLLRTIYGLKNAAMAFWRELVKCFKSMKYEKSPADPCLYFRWTLEGLVIWISWIDDCLVVGPAKSLKQAKDKMIKRFDCDEIGNMNEYVGCKLERNYQTRSLKFTQPVMIQSFVDEFGVEDKEQELPAKPGQILPRCEPEQGMPEKKQKKFRSGTGKLLHMMRWSRPDILNAVRELSKHMKNSNENHYKAMIKVMEYVRYTPNKGLVLRPHGHWDGKQDFKFDIVGYSDATWGSDPDNRRSISGTAVMLNGAPVSMKSGQQLSTTLSSAEAELVAGTSCAQDMLYVKRTLESMGLAVTLPMMLYIDNKGTVDLANNWTVSGRTRHVEIKQYFLRELKEKAMILTRWKSGNTMAADLFTKNLPLALFQQHSQVFVGDA